MSQKFHINKNGVPAPCKATKGNCPLGGDESHFDTLEEAQSFIDRQMAEQHGLLVQISTVKKVELEHDFNETFPDSWHSRWQLVTGVYRDDIELTLEGYDKNAEAYIELHDKIGGDVERIVGDEDVNYVLIPEKNLQAHMAGHVLYPGDERDFILNKDGVVSFDKLTESAEATFGEEVLTESLYSDSDYEFTKEFKEELSAFSAKKVAEDAQFNINGNRVYLDGNNELYKRNWVNEYADAVKNGTEKSKFSVK